MASFRALCLAGVASLVATATAYAADLLPAPPQPVYVAPPPVVLGGNWYLRGDVGVGIADFQTRSSSFDYYVPDARYEQHSLDDSAFIDAGVGYRFNEYFRADVTGEYRASSQFSAIESYNQGYYAHPKNASRSYDNYRGNVRVVDGLVNGYVDIGTWYGATPFIGAGVGVANINSGSVIDSGEGGGSGYSYGKSTTNFAYAGMAGVDFAISRNLKFEIGYRYLNVGKYSSGTIACVNQSPCPNEVQHYRLAYNDIRLGFRYTFADFLPAPSPVVVSRY